MRRLKHAREKNFRQIGGIQLQERIASMVGKESLKMFSIELGKGGFATMYKGVLVDGMPVAIKKPKSVSDEFINEIIVLSHISHRNVVKLLGCCEKIAIETSEAIAYVHLQAAQPIFHPDIKSSNILLENTFTPKVADFGLSRLRSSDDRHLSTMFASGTPGYVDPEFTRSNQFTDKRDVFSFGVVLVELLTALKQHLYIKDLTTQNI
ncbi:hypothetical protein SUGI_0459940 [Cryptomeria japonica]|nr:hypothetical protein SUGI_0459940 [Cryptomeria japonica]